MENQEKAALEEAIRASRAESEARNRELESKIQQLSGLVENLHTRTASPAAAGTAPAAATPSASTTRRPPAFGYRRVGDA